MGLLVALRLERLHHLQVVDVHRPPRVHRNQNRARVRVHMSCSPTSPRASRPSTAQARPAQQLCNKPDNIVLLAKHAAARLTCPVSHAQRVQNVRLVQVGEPQKIVFELHGRRVAIAEKNLFAVMRLGFAAFQAEGELLFRAVCHITLLPDPVLEGYPPTRRLCTIPIGCSKKN
eukprot:3830-Rhodomonas_salina.3